MRQTLVTTGIEEAVAAAREAAGDGGDRCHAPDAGLAIALLMTAPTLNHDAYDVSSGRPAVGREFEAAVPGARADPAPGRETGSGPDDPYLGITRPTAGFAPPFDVTTRVAGYVA